LEKFDGLKERLNARAARNNGASKTINFAGIDINDDASIAILMHLRSETRNLKLFYYTLKKFLCARRSAVPCSQTKLLKHTMSDLPLSETDFTTRLTTAIEKNMANEQFGVSELADEMNMSRSNLLRKVKKEYNLSVSQLISQVRLTRAMELLRSTSQNVSEVSHQVGFNSSSYFIKCFREYYGYPPGEVGKRDVAAAAIPVGKLPDDDNTPTPATPRHYKRYIIIGAVVLVLVVAAIWVWSVLRLKDEEKSIVVLPFKNESSDSSNVYLINGLMEATLNNLQQIQNLRVVSRTSAEKYRKTSKSVSEMAKELNVRYFVEGSGQKIGDKILLNIQLIDGETDKHLWAKQYRRESKDIFELQEEIAQNIASEIEVILTPEEKSRIEKKPTDDLEAYDYYLKGKDLFYRSGRNDLEASIPLFKKAIERDPEFALAYATATMVYYYLDIFNLKKTHADDIELFAEKAMLYDPKSSESLIAKALSFAARQEYELSIPYFEKALEYDPRSGLVLHFLTEFYNIHVPNPAKYLEYAIQKVKVDHAIDSATRSFNYFHLSNALAQTGFLDEALRYNTRSLQLNPKNFFAGYVRAYIHYGTDRSCEKTKAILQAEWKKDTMRFDILQEIGKVNFMMRDFAGARSCYDRAIPIMQMFGMDIFRHEYLRIGAAYAHTGDKAKADYYVNEFRHFADSSQTMYKDMFLASYYSYQGDNAKAIMHFRKFANEQDNFLYWLLLLRDDPLGDNLRKSPEFDPIMKLIEVKFWKKNREMKERFADDFRNL
jgi:TolB-like protein/AraC-like DNA-binding protein